LDQALGNFVTSFTIFQSFDDFGRTQVFYFTSNIAHLNDGRKRRPKHVGVENRTHMQPQMHLLVFHTMKISE
jgi:hypothetical protein